MTAEIDDASTPSGDGTRWLTTTEMQAWLKVWSFHSWLPSRLDAQLRQDFGISHYDYFALAQISMSPGRRLRMSSLAELSDMTLSHLSRVITRLEKTGYVLRCPDPADGRSTNVELTQAGWDFVRAAAPTHVATVRRFVFDQLDADDVADLNRVMGKIVRAMNTPRLPEGPAGR